MKKVMFSLLVAATAVSMSAFTNAKSGAIHAGILSSGSDAGGAYYNVEAFGTTRSECAEMSNTDCSFQFNGSALPAKVYKSDSRISNLESDQVYQ